MYSCHYEALELSGYCQEACFVGMFLNIYNPEFLIFS